MRRCGVRIYRSAFTKLLQIVHDDVCTGREAAENDDVRARFRAKSDVDDVDGVVRSDGINLFLALEVGDCGLRNKDDVVCDFRIGGDAAELSGAKNVTRVGEGGSDADCSGLLIHLAINEDDAAFVRKGAAVAEFEGEGDSVRTLEQIVAAMLQASDERKIFLI